MRIQGLIPSRSSPRGAPRLCRRLWAPASISVKSSSRSSARFVFAPRRQTLFRQGAVCRQGLAGAIERSGNGDARLRMKVEIAGQHDRCSQIVPSKRRNANVAGNLGELGGRNGLFLMDRHGNDATGKTGKILQETGAVLGR